ncbi:hypothetical protein DVH24_019930 [Malus domestica]|uniref:Uncharacterized protein n=1 Tax=Malus domestica TaxID=3750 RepID=A0A498I4B9_MALDO|nr:hypothetical protein DVH24_019930 [Malus domestica]
MRRHLRKCFDVYMCHLVPLLLIPSFLTLNPSKMEYLYRDVILPNLGMHQGTDWDFLIVSPVEIEGEY